MIHLLCSWIYTTNREKVCIGWLENFWWSSRKGQDGNHNKQFFTSTEHQEGAAKITQACKKKKKKSQHPAVGLSTNLRQFLKALSSWDSETHLQWKSLSRAPVFFIRMQAFSGSRSNGGEEWRFKVSMSGVITV